MGVMTKAAVPGRAPQDNFGAKKNCTVQNIVRCCRILLNFVQYFFLEMGALHWQFRILFNDNIAKYCSILQNTVELCLLEMGALHC